MNKANIIETFCNNAVLPKDYNKLGIFKFAKIFFPERFNIEFGIIHYKIMILFFQLLNPEYKYDFERYRYLIIHRQAAKTTLATFLFPIFNIYLKGHTIKVYKSMLNWDLKDINDIVADEIVEIKLDEHFIVIASETASQAENFVLSLKSVIEENNLLSEVFGEKNPEVLEVDEYNRRKHSKVWRTNAFITKDKTIVWGIGTGQKIRGRNIFGYRPSLLIVDDMYSAYNTKTEETRNKLNYWFNAEAINSIDNNIGKVIWLGTMVHPDTVIKEFDTNYWKGLRQPLMSLEDLHSVLTYIKEKHGAFVVPSEVECNALEANIHTLSWKEKHNLYSILMKYQKHLADENLNYFYQEYMNEAIAPELVLIKPDAFTPTNILWKVKDDRHIAEFEYNGIKYTGEAQLYLGLDPASSLAKNSDDTVIVIAGLIKAYPRYIGRDDNYTYTKHKEGVIFPVIAHISGGKYTLYDYESSPGNKVNGIIEYIYSLVGKFPYIKYVNIEANAQQVQIARELRTYFRKKGVTITVWDEYNTTKKEERIMNTLLPFIQNYNTFIYDNKFKASINKLYTQFISLGNADHDDYPDALAIALKNVRMFSNTYSNPNKAKEEYKDEKYEEMIKLFGKENAWMYV